MLIYFVYIWTEIVAAKLWAAMQVQLQLELFPFCSHQERLCVCVSVCMCACVNMCMCVCVCLYFLNQTFAMKLQLAMPISPIVGISFCGTVIKMQTAICHFQLLLSVFFLLPPSWLFPLGFLAIIKICATDKKKQSAKMWKKYKKKRNAIWFNCCRTRPPGRERQRDQLVEVGV